MHLGELVLVSGAAILGFMSLVWVVSLLARQASIVDIVWSLCFVVAAAVALLFGGGAFPRRLLMMVLVSVWGARLSIHILARNWGKGEDYRYATWRERYGPGYWWISLFQVFWLQGLLAVAVSLPIQAAGAGRTPASLAALDGLGAALWLLGFAFETIGDAQLARFKADPANRGKVMDRGLWRYTRHPNYFGDAVVWWGLGLIGLAAPWGWAALVGPAVMTFVLVRVSGVAMLERTIAERRPGYADYVRRTSAFVPLPPKATPAP
ncbi:MAG TPA: DUF1295 domain-containing protein [Actinomycetota bacterium]